MTSFTAAETFDGFRDGFVFTTGSMGTGYYPDSAPAGLPTDVSPWVGCGRRRAAPPRSDVLEPSSADVLHVRSCAESLLADLSAAARAHATVRQAVLREGLRVDDDDDATLDELLAGANLADFPARATGTHRAPSSPYDYVGAFVLDMFASLHDAHSSMPNCNVAGFLGMHGGVDAAAALSLPTTLDALHAPTHAALTARLERMLSLCDGRMRRSVRELELEVRALFAAVRATATLARQDLRLNSPTPPTESGLSAGCCTGFVRAALERANSPAADELFGYARIWRRRLFQANKHMDKLTRVVDRLRQKHDARGCLLGVLDHDTLKLIISYLDTNSTIALLQTCWFFRAHKSVRRRLPHMRIRCTPGMAVGRITVGTGVQHQLAFPHRSELVTEVRAEPRAALVAGAPTALLDVSDREKRAIAAPRAATAADVGCSLAAPPASAPLRRLRAAVMVALTGHRLWKLARATRDASTGPTSLVSKRRYFVNQKKMITLFVDFGYDARRTAMPIVPSPANVNAVGVLLTATAASPSTAASAAPVDYRNVDVQTSMGIQKFADVPGIELDARTGQPRPLDADDILFRGPRVLPPPLPFRPRFTADPGVNEEAQRQFQRDQQSHKESIRARQLWEQKAGSMRSSGGDVDDANTQFNRIVVGKYFQPNSVHYDAMLVYADTYERVSADSTGLAYSASFVAAGGSSRNWSTPRGHDSGAYAFGVDPHPASVKLHVKVLSSAHQNRMFRVCVVASGTLHSKYTANKVRAGCRPYSRESGEQRFVAYSEPFYAVCDAKTIRKVKETTKKRKLQDVL